MVLSEPISCNRMVVDQRTREERLDRAFHALADPTRRDIVRRAMHGDHSVSSLAKRYPMSFAAVQKHVAVLEEVDLVTKRKRGREQLVTTNMQTIRMVRRALDQLEDLWQRRTDRMSEILARPKKEGESR